MANVKKIEFFLMANHNWEKGHICLKKEHRFLKKFLDYLKRMTKFFNFCKNFFSMKLSY